jgi:hypothetical protein
MVRLALLTVAACARPQIAVRGDEVLRHLDELGREGSAHVDTVRIDGSAERAEDREIVFLFQTVTLSDTIGPLSHFVAGCGPFTGVEPCRLRAGDRIMLREVGAASSDVAPPRPQAPHEEQSASTANKAIAATLFFGGLAGTGLCVALCEDHKAAYSIALGSGALVAAVVWAVLSGTHD